MAKKPWRERTKWPTTIRQAILMTERADAGRGFGEVEAVQLD
jgi:hypothetical protein